MLLNVRRDYMWHAYLLDLKYIEGVNTNTLRMNRLNRSLIASLFTYVCKMMKSQP